MAHKKGVGSSNNGRDSKSKRLGVKLFGGQLAKAGNIIVRQRGTKYHAGENAYLGKDFTIHAKVDGTVLFSKRRMNRTYVSVLPFDTVEETVADFKKEKATPVVTPVAPEVVEEEILEEEVVEEIIEETEEEIIEETAIEEVVATAPKTERPAAFKKYKEDDLKIVEGIGPKIESLLKEAGISDWVALSKADPVKIKEILAAAGSRYTMHDPTTWPKQVALAVAGKWDELQAYQDRLDGGKEPEA